MSNYRRFRIKGATYFFTVNLAERGQATLTKNIDMLRHVYALTARRRPFETDAIVVLPDHLHCIWTLPEGDSDFSTRWGAIKSQFTMAICGAGRRAGFSPPTTLPVVQSGRYAGLKPGLRENKREKGVWQRRFWENCIRDEADYREHMRYCWKNPVKHGLVENPEDWPYSSIHRDIKNGTYDPL